MQWERALDLYSYMGQLGKTRSLVTCNTVLSTCQKSGSATGSHVTRPKRFDAPHVLFRYPEEKGRWFGHVDLDWKLQAAKMAILVDAT